MDKVTLYEFCKRKRSEEYEWKDVYKFAKKDKLIPTTMTLDEMLDMYQDVAGQMAVYGRLEQANYDENLSKFWAWLGKSRQIERQQKSARNKSHREETIVISDVHIPNEDKNRIRKVVDRHKDTADRLVILGDFLDGHSLSTHPKLALDSLKEECIEGRKYLEWFAADFPEVILTYDNSIHSRYLRMIADRLTPDQFFLMTHPYKYITAGLDNVKLSCDVLNTQFNEEFGWMHVLGKDCVMAHAEVSGREMKAARRVEEFANKWKRHLNIEKIRFTLQAHVHQVGIFHDDDSAIAYSGCMVSLDGVRYSMSAKCFGGPPIRGYAKIVQYDGVTSLEESQVYRLYED